MLEKLKQRGYWGRCFGNPSGGKGPTKCELISEQLQKESTKNRIECSRVIVQSDAFSVLLSLRTLKAFIFWSWNDHVLFSNTYSVIRIRQVNDIAGSGLASDTWLSHQFFVYFAFRPSRNQFALI